MAVFVLGLFLGYSGLARYKDSFAAYEMSANALPLSMEMEARVSQVVAEVRVLQMAMTEYYGGHRAWPTRLDAGYQLEGVYSNFGKVVERYAISGSGQISLVLAGAGLQGRTLLFTPVPYPQEDTFHWRCSSPDIPGEWLPSMCRE
jgi:hypothetical protein